MKFTVLSKEALNPTVSRMVLSAPLIAAKAKAGQFIILRARSESERIPLTIADYDREKGTITIIYQIVGGATMELDTLAPGESLADLAGPLGKPSELEGLHKVAVIGGGVGCAIAYPTAKALHQAGCSVHMVAGFRNKELVILSEEMAAVSDHYQLMTDDGSAGEHGFVTTALEELMKDGNHYDTVIAIGPLPMMRAISDLTERYDMPCVVSMNPIMIDGTGMCGGCRLTVGGEVKFACVDGPEFDGHLVDFEEAMRRGKLYAEQEKTAREAACRLLKEDQE